MKAVLIPTEDSAVAYYRIEMVAQALRALGWDVPHITAGTIELDDLDALCKGADIIVSQRPGTTRSTAALRAEADLNNCPLVMDLDDDFLDIAKTNPAYTFMQAGSEGLTAAMIALNAADAVTVSTTSLKASMAFLSDDITVLGNCQDMKLKVKKGKPVAGRIGWAGSSSHQDDLLMIWPWVKRHLESNREAEFYIWGFDPGIKHRQVTVDTELVPYHLYLPALASKGFSVGIIPLVDRPFNQAKSTIKWQEYTRVGVPSIASRVGEYRTLHIRTARNKNEWLEALDAPHMSDLMLPDIAKNINQWVKTYERIIAKHRNTSRDE